MANNKAQTRQAERRKDIREELIQHKAPEQAFDLSERLDAALENVEQMLTEQRRAFVELYDKGAELKRRLDAMHLTPDELASTGLDSIMEDWEEFQEQADAAMANVSTNIDALKAQVRVEIAGVQRIENLPTGTRIYCAQDSDFGCTGTILRLQEIIEGNNRLYVFIQKETGQKFEIPPAVLAAYFEDDTIRFDDSESVVKAAAMNVQDFEDLLRTEAYDRELSKFLREIISRGGENPEFVKFLMSKILGKIRDIGLREEIAKRIIQKISDYITDNVQALLSADPQYEKDMLAQRAGKIKDKGSLLQQWERARKGVAIQMLKALDNDELFDPRSIAALITQAAEEVSVEKLREAGHFKVETTSETRPLNERLAQYLQEAEEYLMSIGKQPDQGQDSIGGRSRKEHARIIRALALLRLKAQEQEERERAAHRNSATSRSALLAGAVTTAAVTAGVTFAASGELQTAMLVGTGVMGVGVVRGFWEKFIRRDKSAKVAEAFMARLDATGLEISNLTRKAKLDDTDIKKLTELQSALSQALGTAEQLHVDVFTQEKIRSYLKQVLDLQFKEVKDQQLDPARARRLQDLTHEDETTGIVGARAGEKIKELKELRNAQARAEAALEMMQKARNGLEPTAQAPTASSVTVSAAEARSSRLLREVKYWTKAGIGVALLGIALSTCESHAAEEGPLPRTPETPVLVDTATEFSPGVAFNEIYDTPEEREYLTGTKKLIEQRLVVLRLAMDGRIGFLDEHRIQQFSNELIELEKLNAEFPNAVSAGTAEALLEKFTGKDIELTAAELTWPFTAGELDYLRTLGVDLTYLETKAAQGQMIKVITYLETQYIEGRLAQLKEAAMMSPSGVYNVEYLERLWQTKQVEKLLKETHQRLYAAFTNDSPDPDNIEMLINQRRHLVSWYQNKSNIHMSNGAFNGFSRRELLACVAVMQESDAENFAELTGNGGSALLGGIILEPTPAHGSAAQKWQHIREIIAQETQGAFHQADLTPFHHSDIQQRERIKELREAGYSRKEAKVVAWRESNGFPTRINKTLLIERLEHGRINEVQYFKELCTLSTGRLYELMRYSHDEFLVLAADPEVKPTVIEKALTVRAMIVAAYNRQTRTLEPALARLDEGGVHAGVEAGIDRNLELGFYGTSGETRIYPRDVKILRKRVLADLDQPIDYWRDVRVAMNKAGINVPISPIVRATFRTNL